MTLDSSTKRPIALLLALAALTLAAAPAQAHSKAHLKFARCAGGCRTVTENGDMVVGGRGFTTDEVAVFTVRNEGFLMNATTTTTYMSQYRLRVHVPANAVSGPLYLLDGVGRRSNRIKVRIHAPARACPSTPGPGNAVMRWVPVVACDLALLHQPVTNEYITDVLIIIQNESGGNPRSINNWDSNAAHGDPSRGLMQTIGATFNAYRSPALSPSIYDPAANIYAGLNYGIARYGSIPNIPGVKSVRAGRGYVPYKQGAQ